MSDNSILLFPGNPLYDATLIAAPAMFDNSGEFTIFAGLPDGGDLLIPLSGKEAEEYMYGGGYEERMINDLGWTSDELNEL